MNWIHAVIGIVLIGIIITCISIAVKNMTVLATPDNIARIKQQQTALLEKQWTGFSQRMKGIDAGFNLLRVPDSQRLLINTNVLGVRLVGSVGPFSSPVFDEVSATRFALASGARCLVLEIDREESGTEPKLIYRDSWGMKRSLNMGSLELVAKQLAGRAFTTTIDSTPSGVVDDPLLLVLYFVNTPNPAEKPLDYTRFLGKVAEALQPISNLLLGQTPQGDFRRQALESQLFYQPLETLKRRIVVLTNADTTPFRRLKQIGLAGELGNAQDLDGMVHARLYSRESPSGLGITASPAGNQQASAVITTPKYWLNTPPDRLADAVSQTKKAWTLVMTPVASDSDVPTKSQLNTLLTTYGVQCVPITLFQPEAINAPFVSQDGVYKNTSWTPKPDLIRYIPVPPIITQKPIPQTNSGGGAIRSPV